MTKRSKNLKFAALVPALLLMVLSVSVVYGGLRWSGIDSEIDLGGQTLNATAEWHSDELCSISGDIEINVYYPIGLNLGDIKESTADCGDAGTITTDTHAYPTDSSKVTVTGLIPTGEQMPARLILDLNGNHIRTCGGQSNTLITCGSFNLK